MESVKKNKRNGTIDIYRLLFALAIMAGHATNLGLQAPFPFAGVGIFVEFFFLLTGYYTYQHFSNHELADSTDWLKNSLCYTIRKFMPMMPYLAISVLARYLYDGIVVIRSGGGIIYALKNLVYAPFELFLTNYIFDGIPQKVGALYFLSAMVFVFPVFCILCQLKNKTVKAGIAMYLVLFYYHNAESAITASYPQVLARAFCGMCLGLVIHYVIEEFGKHFDLGKLKSRMLYLLGNILLLFSMFLSGISHDNRRIQLLCIFFGVMIVQLLNGKLGVASGKISDYFSKLSMVIFVIHWTIGVILNGTMNGAELVVKVFAYYVITIIVAVALLLVFDRKSAVRKRIR